MPLYRVTQTVTAVVEAKDSESAMRARFRSDWSPYVDAAPLTDTRDIPEDWHDFPPIRPDGKDAGTTTVRELLTPGAKRREP